jgi:hypothetical protein
MTLDEIYRLDAAGGFDSVEDLKACLEENGFEYGEDENDDDQDED